MLPLRANVVVIGDRPCGEVAEAHPLVQTAIRATRSVDREPDLAMSSTDANVPISLGIPRSAIFLFDRTGRTIRFPH